MDLKKNSLAGPRQIQDWYYNKSLKEDQIPEYFSIGFERENIDHKSLNDALRKLYERHNSLRTSFFRKGRDIFQSIIPYTDKVFGLKEFDLSQVESENRFISNTVTQYSNKLKILDDPPLSYCLLFKKKNNVYSFSFLIHHIVSDDDSVKILKKEINILYKSFRNKTPSSLPILPYQLEDFLDLERKNTNQITHTHKYWAKKFALLEKKKTTKQVFKTLAANLNINNPQDSQDSFTKILDNSKGKKFEYYTDCNATEVITKLKEKHFFNLGAIITAIFFDMLCKTNNQMVHLIASPISGRYNPRSKNLVGNLMGGIYYCKKKEVITDFRKKIKYFQNEYFKSAKHIIYNHEMLKLDLPFLRVNCDLFLNIFKAESEYLVNPDTASHILIDSPHFFLQCDVSPSKGELNLSWKYNSLAYSEGKIEKMSGDINEIIKKISQL